MLSKLFGSQARVKILKVFLLNPHKKFYIRQLGRDLKLQVNSVRRELENLEKFGLLSSSLSKEEPERTAEEKEEDKAEISSNRQEKKYYQTRADFVLFEEIKALIVKAQVLYERDFSEKIKKLGNVKLFVLTGLFVNQPLAPTDMLVVGRFGNKAALHKVIKDLEKDLGREINFTVMDPREYKYRRDMTDVFLYEILEGKKVVVVDEDGQMANV